jgi:hypothetical protein
MFIESILASFTDLPPLPLSSTFCHMPCTKFMWLQPHISLNSHGKYVLCHCKKTTFFWLIYRYLQPPSEWVACALESRELLSLCLKKLKGLNKVKLVDAGFIWTEPHSKRIKVCCYIQYFKWVVSLHFSCQYLHK